MALPVEMADSNGIEDANPSPGAYYDQVFYASSPDKELHKSTFRYGSKIYVIFFDTYGDTYGGSGFDPTHYYRKAWQVFSSSDNGVTWSSSLDYANRILTVSQASGYGGSRGQVVQIGSVLWLFYDYSTGVYTPIPMSSDFTVTSQSDKIYAVSFNMATDTWGTPITTGCPAHTPPDSTVDTLNAISTPLRWQYWYNNVTKVACVRGSDEVVVLHEDTNYSVTPQRALYSIFNTTSGTWTSINNVVFTDASTASTANNNVYPSSIEYDGTYVHFVAEMGIHTTSANQVKWHRTLNSSNTLGSVSDMLSGWFPDLSPAGTFTRLTGGQSSEDFLLKFGTELLCVFLADWRPFSFYPTFLIKKLVCVRAPSGVQNPTWGSVENMLSTDWDAAFDFSGDSDPGILVQADGNLYCLAGGYVFGTGGYNPSYKKYWVYSQKYLSSGSWEAPIVWWGEYKDVIGYATNGGALTLFCISALSDLPGTGAGKIALSAHWGSTVSSSVPEPPLNSNSVYWFIPGTTSLPAQMRPQFRRPRFPSNT